MGPVVCDEDVVGQVVKAALLEHTNIAETLHKTVFQDWAALLIRLGTMGLDVDMQELQILVAQATNNLPRVLNTLRPPRGPGGLSFRLGILTRVFSDHFEFPVTGPCPDQDLYSHETEAAALSVAQKVLTTACVLGKPETSLSLHSRNSKLRMIIELAGFSEKLGALRERLGKLDCSIEADPSVVSVLFLFPSEETDSEAP